ncbi:MAG TPA: ABC transporter ATP-binding protein [Gemmatimonadales bacterium]|nr:ABC transporter ATP-binding protein [Gemmatimonadales bacterium]
MPASSRSDSPPVVELVRVSKHFGEVRAVDAVSFAIRRGEFFSLLGPSGCGKTTTLRLLAGLEEPDDDGGEIRLLGETITRRRPYERNLAMVFQSYALFPHLTVERNVAFGLEQRKVPRGEIGERVRRALEMVRLAPDKFARRMPAQLSGGQRQRVALARALVLGSPILLLDEPLGALDLKLRKEMQLELRQLNHELGVTFVYVTHDQEEALTMSDRIAVMDHGRIVQVGTPAEVYENPRTAFVAGFIGTANFFRGRVERRGPDGCWEVAGRDGLRFRVPHQPGLGDGVEVEIAVRPEWMDVFPPDRVPPEENAVPGTVREVMYLGETMHVVAAIAPGRDVTVAVRNEGQLIKPLPWRRGDAVAIGWLPEDSQVLEAD